MKKSVLKALLCASVALFLVMGEMTGCSSDDGNSEPMLVLPKNSGNQGNQQNPENPQNPGEQENPSDSEDPDTPEVPDKPGDSGDPENPAYVDGTTTKTETVAVTTSWIFSDLGPVAIEGADAATAFADADSLAAAATAYTTFSAAKDKKYSLKSDVDYLSSDKKMTAQIKSLGADGVPIQYNKYESGTDDCGQTDSTAGCLQIQGEAIAIRGVQGPFKIKVNYGANSSKAKTDGRYAYVKINGTEYDDEAVKAAKSLSAKGSGFTTAYVGTDTVDIAIGTAGVATSLVRLYDIIISKDAVRTTTVTTTTNADGTVTLVTTVTDEAGNVVSTKTETIDPKAEEKEREEAEKKPSERDPTATEEYTNGEKIGRRTKLNEVNTADIANAIRVSTAAEFEVALASVQAGGAVVLAAGTYAFDHQVTIALGNDGTATAMKYIMPETGAKVTLDFSSQSYGDTSTNARGLQINANYWHVYGLTVYGAADNGIMITGNNNIVERCILQANRDTGLQISRRLSSLKNIEDWPHDNLILNCTAFDNHDPATDENADGFAAKLTCGNGNVFDGCIAYCNSDDGWDLYAKTASGPIGVVTIRNCIAFGNGMLTTGSSFANGDMNGFKLGGSNGAVPTAHVIYNCMAFGNGHSGFTDNGNGGGLSVTACTAYNNVKTNFNFDRTNGGKFYKLITAGVSNNGSERFAGDAGKSTIEKVLYFNSKKYYYVDDAVDVVKTDKVGTAVSDPYPNEFVSGTAPAADETVDARCRNVDGTINIGGYLETKKDSTYAALGARFGAEAYEVLPITLQLR